MTAAMAMPGNTAETFLVHFFGTGLADDRYVVERYKARADGDVVPAPVEALAAKGRRAAVGRKTGPGQQRREERARTGERDAGGRWQPVPPRLARRDRDRVGRGARGPAGDAPGRRDRVRGGGEEVDSERARGLACFSRSWLDRLNLDATRCAIIRVRGESMEPTSPDGYSILFDRNQRTPRDGRIYVVRVGDGLIVKRASKRGGGWELASENPAVESEPWPADAEVVGEVVLMAQTVI